MAVIYNNWVSIQALNRTEAMQGKVVFVGREGNYLVYWELIDGKMEKFPSEREATKNVSSLHLVLRQMPGCIEILDVGDQKAVVTGRFLSGEEE